MKDSRATNDGIMSTLKKQNPNTTESESNAATGTTVASATTTASSIGTSTATASMKQHSSSSTTPTQAPKSGQASTNSNINSNSNTRGNSKPNAWSKPLQGAPSTQATATTSTAPTTTTDSASSNNNSKAHTNATSNQKQNYSNYSNKGTTNTNTNNNLSNKNSNTKYNTNSNVKNRAPPGLAKPNYSSNTEKASSNTSSNTNNKVNSNNSRSINAHHVPILRDRYLHLLLTLTGQKVTVTMKAPSNVQYTGILHTATPFGHLPESQRNKYVLKAATAVGEDKDDAVKIMPGQTILLDMDKVMQLHVKSCRLDALVGSHNKTNSNSSSDAFTDAEISGAAAHTLSLRDKDLVQADATWTSAGDVGSLGAPPPVLNSRATLMAGGGGGSAPTHTTPSINTSSGASNTNVAGSALQGSISGWDQFKANKELFNVTGSYDENVYTTALDKSQFSASDRQRAEILAREIESSTTSNLHIAEERGHIMNQDYDEEDRYSGVLSKPKAPAASAATRNNATTAPIFTSTESASRPKKLNYAQAVAAAKSGEPNPPGFRLSGETNVTATSENGVDGATVSEAIEAKKKKNAPVKQLLKAAETKAGNEPVESKPVSKVVEEVSTEIEVDEEPHQAMPEELSSDATDEPKFKLRASAKSFSFNINAKTFMPMPPPPPPPPPPQQQHFIDPSTAMPVMMAMGAPMMPGGMIPIMMNPGQYPGTGIRFTSHYPGMEHLPHAAAGPHQTQQHGPPHPPSTASPMAPSALSASDAPSPITVSDAVPSTAPVQPQILAISEGDSALPSNGAASLLQHHPSPSPHPALPHLQHQIHMPVQSHAYYPSNYFAPPMGMVPHHQQQPQHHFMHPQMAHMHRQMYPVTNGIPPNMMRGPTYYPTQNGHMPYPPQYGSGGFGADEDGMNIGGRGGGVPARGGRGRGPGGRMARGQGQGRGGSNLAAGRSGSGGRGRFNHQYSGVSNSSSHGDSNERETPQDPPSQTFAESIPPASMLAPQSHEVVPAMPSSVQIEDNVVENLTRNTDPVASNDPPGHVEDSVTS